MREISSYTIDFPNIFQCKTLPDLVLAIFQFNDTDLPNQPWTHFARSIGVLFTFPYEPFPTTRRSLKFDKFISSDSSSQDDIWLFEFPIFPLFSVRQTFWSIRLYQWSHSPECIVRRTGRGLLIDKIHIFMLIFPTLNEQRDKAPAK